MAKSSLLLLLLLLSILSIAAAAAAGASSPSSATFIKAKCSATKYPDLCVRSLSPYASEIQQNSWKLAATALNVSLATAQSAKAFVGRLSRAKGMRPREVEALHDCVDEMADTVYRLNRSCGELERAGRARREEFLWRISNVQTWVSAALTDDNTCTDGFPGQILNGRVKASVSSGMLSVEHSTSNALALINQYASKHNM
ncbi:hypothetical protein Nepgr_020184 [Nepenthes gracilis]|uniref:Pectinesterase inhibitor domain-containing protein n=1 Tax=Nepenthes gracilis TaxID=150966 RepID=A0AAD3XV12_NEPGR|nr:hypothetical protein Nepgr_020184 [Nepenthes gracilis]